MKKYAFKKAQECGRFAVNIMRCPDLKNPVFWVQAALVALFLAVTATRIYTFDFWWHLKTGELILATGRPPLTDPFSGPGFGNPWFNFHWLFQVLIAWTHSQFGMPSMTLLKITAYGLMIGAALKVQTKRNWTREFILFIALLGLSSRVMLRPELATYLILLAMALLLDRPMTRRHWMLLPLLQVLLANCHSVFLLGPLLVFLRGLAALVNPSGRREAWRWLALALLCVPLSALTPYGLSGLTFPLQLIAKVTFGADVYKHTIAEFLPPRFEGADVFLWPYLLTACACLYPLVRRRRLFPALILIVFLVLALQARRNFNLLLAVSLPFVLECGGFFPEHLISRRGLRWIRSVLLIVSLGYAALFAGNRIYRFQNRLERTGLGMNEVIFSSTLPHTLQSIPTGTRIFNTMSLGGYLIYHAPHLPVYYDGRLDVYDRDHYHRYLELIQSAAVFTDSAEGQATPVVILNHAIEEAPRLLDLAKNPDWGIAHLDFQTVVLVRRDWAAASGLALWHRERLEDHLQPLFLELSRYAAPDQELLLILFGRTAHRLGLS